MCLVLCVHFVHFSSLLLKSDDCEHTQFLHGTISIDGPLTAESSVGLCLTSSYVIGVKALTLS